MNKKLSGKQTLLISVTLFGMFFGAGNLIFPVHLGQMAGQNTLPATIGFIITAVGLPVLGVAAIGNTHSEGLHDLACNKIGRKYGYFFTCLLYLTIGPLFAIPRCATTSFTTGVAPMIGDAANSPMPLFVFSLCFFIPVLFFSLRPSKITVWVGKVITPVFLIFLAILVFAALVNPGASISSVIPTDGYESGAFFSSFIEGYATMDAIASLAFGIVIINIVRDMGLNEDSSIAKQVMKSGVIAGIIMAVIYALIIVMGAQSRGLFDTSENGGIALAQIAGHYLGSVGSIVLACTITLACLKTSIGLVTSCAEVFEQMFPNGPKYRVWAVIFTVFSFGLSNIGLSSIINYSVPVLMFIYPLAITLILLAIFGKLFNHDKAVYVSVTCFTLVAALFDFAKTLPAGVQETFHLGAFVDFGAKILPFFDLSLGWLVPAIIGLVIGLVIKATRKNKSVA